MTELRELWAHLNTNQTTFFSDDPAWDRFYRAMIAFDVAEAEARRTSNWSGCLWGPGKRCPDDSPVNCRGCATVAAEVPQKKGEVA